MGRCADGATNDLQIAHTAQLPIAHNAQLPAGNTNIFMSAENAKSKTERKIGSYVFYI